MQKAPLRILLVEDERIHAELLRRSLQLRYPDLELFVAPTLHAARSHMATISLDLAIVDLNLPDGKGTELLQNDPEKATLPVLIMTGQGDEQAAVEAIKAGALDYLVKSAATLAELPKIIERTLREWRNITERRRAEEALRESEARFRTVFEHASAGMAVISPEGQVLQVNPTFCRLSGYSREECLEKNVFEVTYPDDRQASLQLYQDLKAGRRSHFDIEKRYVCKDGTVMWGHLTVAGVYGADRQLIYCVAMVMNIDERKQAEQKIQEAYRELDTFVTTVSHDLRLPLTPIIGYADFLRHEYKDRLDESALQILQSISSQGHRMTSIMEDLLTLSKVGRVEMPERAVDAGKVAREVVRDLSEAIRSAGTSVTIGNLPAIRVPESLLSQVFANLLGNAVHYAGRASDTIEVGCDPGPSSLRLFVRDHGPGIAETERERIFQQFYRCRGSAEIPGTGLGLAIVAKIANHFGGRAWADETPGGGTTIWVELPA